MLIANPQLLWLIRHGQSVGNVAREAAHDADLERLDLAQRDMDVPLSSLGREQAAAFGAWLGSEPEGRRPQVMISSPYARAVETTEVIVASASLARVEVRRDERLRERELGVLDLLTRRGVEVQFPLEAERRLRLGKLLPPPTGWGELGGRRPPASVVAGLGGSRARSRAGDGRVARGGDRDDATTSSKTSMRSRPCRSLATSLSPTAPSRRSGPVRTGDSGSSGRAGRSRWRDPTRRSPPTTTNGLRRVL